MSEKSKNINVRIGTLVSAGKGSDPANYMRQILPYGFESFSLTFWGAVGDVDLKQMAEEVNGVIAASNAVISSLAIFGNPLEEKPADLEARKGWEELIDQVNLACLRHGLLRTNIFHCVMTFWTSELWVFSCLTTL